jgi:hypothetical protein
MTGLLKIRREKFRRLCHYHELRRELQLTQYCH